MPKKIKQLKSPSLKEEINPSLLGKAVKARRTQSNLRLEDASALCGVAKQTLLDIEHGKPSTRLSTILQVCSGLGIKIYIAPWVNEEEADDWL